MRGIANYNFPAFDAAAALARKMGYEPVNPADLDRAVGVSETTDPLPKNFLRDAMTRDLGAICTCDAIAVLPGWEASAGVKVELALAELLGLEILDAKTFEPLERESILAEAERLVTGDRNGAYGHPHEDFTRTAKIWSGILGFDVSPEQIGLCMIGLKLSREVHRHKHDNLVDMAGYAKTVDMVHEYRRSGKHARERLT